MAGASTNQFINGFEGVVLCGAFSLDVTEWDGDIETEILDTTNTSGYDPVSARGWQSNINGVSKMSGSVKTYFDIGSVPFGVGGCNVRNGTSVTLTLTIGSSGKVIICPARVGKVTVNNPVKAVVPFEFTYESNGIITLPS
jgi:hypothetical protein